MTTLAAGIAQRGGRAGRAIARFWSGISAVSIKELRGRMRGRRAFVVMTIYLLLLGLFAFGIYVYLKQQAGLVQVGFGDGGVARPGFPNTQTLANGTALSAGIGHGIFGGLIFLETLLVLVLAPAFTTGAISLEREKQTIDMLVTTPLSTLGMVIGKLFSALVYVFLLIIASVPLASLVFVFGGVGPEDLLRAYVFLFALAFGMGAIGLFISALVKRTQTATVVTFVVVLLLSIGTAAGHQFWQVAGRQGTSGGLLLTQRSSRAPEALVWLNPFVANLDMICATAPDTYHASCEYISGVTGRPYFGTPGQTQPGFEGVPVPMDGDEPLRHFVDGGAPGGGQVGADGCTPEECGLPHAERDIPAIVAEPCPPNARCVAPPGEPTQAVTLGFPRDTFWPKTAAAFVALGVVLTFLSSQLVAPSRRLRLPRPIFRRPRKPDAGAPTTPIDTSDQPPPEAAS